MVTYRLHHETLDSTDCVVEGFYFRIKIAQVNAKSSLSQVISVDRFTFVIKNTV